MNFKKPEIGIGTTAIVILAAIGIMLLTNGQVKEADSEDSINNQQLEAVIAEQLEKGLATIADVAPERLAVAYEPVWAIGTGKVAGPEEIVEAHAIVRAKLLDILKEKANSTRVLYGGSVKPENASQIIVLDNVDGVLVGGASLKAESFSKIVTA